MQKEVVIFDQDYLDIPLQDMPDRGHLIVCKDPQRRLKPEETWAVVQATSNKGGAPPKALGLFWDKEEAIFYAESVANR